MKGKLKQVVVAPMTVLQIKNLTLPVVLVKLLRNVLIVLNVPKRKVRLVAITPLASVTKNKPRDVVVLEVPVIGQLIALVIPVKKVVLLVLV